MDEVDPKLFLTRCKEGKRKNIYFTSSTVRDLTRINDERITVKKSSNLKYFIFQLVIASFFKIRLSILESKCLLAVIIKEPVVNFVLRRRFSFVLPTTFATKANQVKSA